MTNEELIAKIKAEIERRKDICSGVFERNSDTYYQGKAVAYDEALSFLSTLESEKPVPNDLEEAAWDCVLDSVDVNNPVLLPKYKVLLTSLFIDGAKWQKEQMMKEAVEGKVFMSFAPGHNQMVMADVDLPTNTKVRIIIVEEWPIYFRPYDR